MLDVLSLHCARCILQITVCITKGPRGLSFGFRAWILQSSFQSLPLKIKMTTYFYHVISIWYHQKVHMKSHLPKPHREHGLVR